MNDIDINQTIPKVAAILLAVVGILVPNLQPIFIGAMAENLGFSASQLGYIAGIESFGVGLSSILAIFWIGRLNWQNASFFSLAFLAIGNLVSVFLIDFTTLLIARGLIGFFGGGILFAISLAALSNCKNIDRVFSYMVLAQVTSMFLGMLLMPYAIPYWGVAGVLVPVAILAAITLPAARFMPTKSNNVERLNIKKYIGNGPIFWGIAAQLVWYIGVGGVWAFIERIGDNAGLSGTDIGLALGLGMILSVAGTILAAIFADRFGRLLPFTLAMLVQVFVLFGLFGFSTVFEYGVIWTFFNLAWNYGLTYMYSGTADADYTGKYIVMIPSGQNFGLAIGMGVGGVLVANFGLNSVVYAAIFCNFIAIVLFSIMIKRRKQDKLITFSNKSVLASID